jgi:superfamily II DNA or RNA helicase
VAPGRPGLLRGRCCAEDLEHLYLPRGVTEAAAALVAEAGSRLDVDDVRSEPAPLAVTFTGALREFQAQAVQELGRHELGVLEAPPGAGKTVMGCALIARHRTPTLVLVDRRELLDQWRAQLRTNLGLEAGQIGAGKRNQTRAVDIATFQTVVRSDRPDELLDGYGLVVIDECHRVAAPPSNAPCERRERGGGSASPQPRSDPTASKRSWSCSAGRSATASTGPTTTSSGC